TLMIEETPERFRERMNSKRKNDRKNGLPNLAVQISSMLPTPRAQEANGGIQPVVNGAVVRKDGTRHGPKLKDVVAMLPTPATRDYKGSGKQGRDTVDSVIEMGARKGQIGEKTGLRL